MLKVVLQRTFLLKQTNNFVYMYNKNCNYLKNKAVL